MSAHMHAICRMNILREILVLLVTCPWRILSFTKKRNDPDRESVIFSKRLIKLQRRCLDHRRLFPVMLIGTTLAIQCAIFAYF